jgi:pSer/pThr/pTyr-binding forkhead associated (FHA) protein
MRAQLVPLDGGSAIEIAKDLILVGRKEECDVRLDHKSVSKMHCVIVKTDGLLLLRDLGSTNGTRVNGQRVRRAILVPNDQVGIANYKFRVVFGDAPEEPPPPSVRPNEHTQRIEPDEVAELLRKAKERDEPAAADSAEIGNMPLQRNNLPDVYPEDEAKS